MTPAQAKIAAWRRDPVLFVREQFGAEPDVWQHEVLRAWGDPGIPRIAMQACAGPGKTAVESWCGWHGLTCFGEVGHHPMGLATSVTTDNLKDNLWKEFAVWQGRSPFLSHAFVWTKERIFAKDHPETWFLSARSWSKKANPDEQGRTLSGLHAKYIFYLIDESGDIAPAVGRSAEQGLSNCVWGKILQGGNPTSHEGMLYQAATVQRHLWHLISITGDPDDPRRSPRISIEWAREQIALYGRENPWVMAYILGLFPPSSINALLGPDEVNSAMGKHLREDQYDWAQKRLGVDVARFGDDRSVIFPRQGLASFTPTVLRGMRTTDIAARIMQIKTTFASEVELVDDTGHWGHGVIDNLLTAGHSPLAVQFHAPALDPRYKNRRAEMWIEMAEWIKRGGALPDVPELSGELTTPTYTFSQGKLQLEDKDLIKARLGRSPDLADALALTFAIPDQPRSEGLLLGRQSRRGQVLVEYDPYAEDVHR